MADNIKLGPGGIREIEFIAQAFQIVRGGRRPELRTRSLLDGVAAPGRRPAAAGQHRRGARGGVSLSAHGRESHPGARTTSRRMSCRPSARSARGSRMRWASRAGRRSSRVSRSSARSSRPSSSASPGKRRARRHATSIRSRAAWAAGDIAAMLAGTSLAGDERAVELLKDLRHGGLYQRMDEVGRQRLAAVMVRTMDALDGASGGARSVSSACCRCFAPSAGAARISRC